MAATDVIFIGIVIFVIGIGFFVFHYEFNVVVDQVVNNSVINTSSGSVQAFESIRTVTNRLDYVVLGLFIGLVLALMITSYFVGGNPLFMFIYFVVIVVGVVLSFVLSNVWETVTQSGQFQNTIVSFPYTNNILLHLPTFMVVIGFIGVVVMFAKPLIGGDYG